MFIIWFAVIMIGVLGGIFTILSKKLCEPMAELDMGWMYSAVVIIPAWIVYMVTAGITTQNLLTDLLANLTVYGEKMKGSAYLIFAFGSVGVGDMKASLIMIALAAVTFLMMWILISKSFLQVATATGKVTKVEYRKKAMKQESITKALLLREFKHFTSSPGYMLNSGLGVFLMPVCAAALLWKGRKLFTMLNPMFGSQDGSVLLLVTIMLCGLISMNIMTAPSISLEGKSLWIAQSLPVTPWQVLRVKLDIQHFCLLGM